MPQVDYFERLRRNITAPGESHFSITPADGVDLPIRPRVLYVLTGGDLVVRDSAGITIAYPVVAGQIFHFSAVGIESTGTTATVAGWV